MNRCMVVISQHHSMFEIHSNLDITNLKIVNFLISWTKLSSHFEDLLSILHLILFHIVNKKGLTDLFVILRFEICTKIYNEKEVLLNLRLQQRKLRYFLKSLTIQRANKYRLNAPSSHILTTTTHVLSYIYGRKKNKNKNL